MQEKCIQNYKYRFAFVPKGVTAQYASGKEIWIDVGNANKEGVFDHHAPCMIDNKETSFKSTVDMLTSKYGFDLLKKTCANFQQGDTIYIYTHEKPDMDAIVSIFLVQEYLEKGTEIYKKNYYRENTDGPALYQCLIDYANSVDEGKNKVVYKVDENKKEIFLVNLYTLICCLDIIYKKQNSQKKEDAEMSCQMISMGIQLIKDFLKLQDQNTDKKPPHEIEFTSTSIEGYFEEAKRLITEESFEEDYKKGKVKIKNLPMWKKDGTIEENVQSAIWNEKNTGLFDYLYARKEGAVLTFVPHEEYKGGIISFDMDKKNGMDIIESLTLLPIADMLERLEQIKEKKYIGDYETKTRDYGSPRGDLSIPSNAIFFEAPFSETDDPWYIKVNRTVGEHSEDIVDGPRSGSRLSNKEIIQVIENITHAVDVSFNITITKGTGNKKSTNSVEKYGKESFYDWNRRTTKWFSEDIDSTYKVAVVQVSSEIIAKGPELLDSYYMTVNGGSYLQNDTMRVLRLDYRTHLYVNKSNAVLFYTENSNIFKIKTVEEVSTTLFASCQRCDKSLKINMMNAVISGDVKNEKDVNNGTPDINIISDIVSVIYNLVRDRDELNLIGGKIEKTKKYSLLSSNKIAEYNDELIKLAAKMQRDECSFNTKVKLDVYHFVKDILGIESLKNTVTSTVELVLEDHKETIYSFINILAKVAVPIALLENFMDLQIFSLQKILEGFSDNVGSIIFVIFIFVFIWGCFTKTGKRFVKKYLDSLNKVDET